MSRTLKKEFGEEAMNSLEASEEEKREIERQVNKLFQSGTEVTSLFQASFCKSNGQLFTRYVCNFIDLAGLKGGCIGLSLDTDVYLQIYAGYVEDPRNTDNAWIETIAVNYHDDSGEAFGKMKLSAGDDARAVAWTEVHKDMDIYPSHAYLLHEVAKLRDAAW